MAACSAMRGACGIAEARGPVAAQIGNQHPMAGLDQRRRHVVPGANIVRETVQQDTGKPRGASVFISDVEHRGLDGAAGGLGEKLCPR